MTFVGQKIMTKLYLAPTKTPFCYVTFANMNVCNMTKRLMKKKYAEKAGMWVTDKTFDKSSYPKSFTYWFCTLGLVRFRYALHNFEMEKSLGTGAEGNVCVHARN